MFEIGCPLRLSSYTPSLPPRKHLSTKAMISASFEYRSEHTDGATSYSDVVIRNEREYVASSSVFKLILCRNSTP